MPLDFSFAAVYDAAMTHKQTPGLLSKRPRILDEYSAAVKLLIFALKPVHVG